MAVCTSGQLAVTIQARLVLLFKLDPGVILFVSAKDIEHYENTAFLQKQQYSCIQGG